MTPPPLERDYLSLLADLVATVQDSNQRLTREKSLSDKAFSKTTPGEKKDLNHNLLGLSLGWGSGTNAQKAEALLRLEETKLGYFERANLSIDEMANAYRPVWINSEHLAIVSEKLKLPKLAKVLTRSLELKHEPEKPTYRAKSQTFRHAHPS